METKTQVHALPDRQELFITREFSLPVSLLFKAYAEPELLAQWMGTHVVKLENRAHGGYRFETTDPRGQVHGFHGTIHEFVPNQKITRTFEMENSGFGPQLEFLEFEALDEKKSKLLIHTVFRSIALRDALLRLPFARGIDLAHNRLENLFTL